MSGGVMLPLGEICRNASRRFAPPEDGKVWFINTGDVEGGRFTHNDLHDWEGLPGQAKKAVVEGDILYSEIRPGNGRYAFVDQQYPNAVVSTKFMVIEASESILPKYLYHVITSPELQNAMKLIAESRSGTFPQITFDSIAHLELMVPSKPEQLAVSSLLDAIEGRIRNNQKMNQTLEEIAKAIFKSWFVDFDPVRAKAEGRPTDLPPAISDLFPDELVDSEIGEIPKGWSPSVAGDLFDCLDRKRIPLSGNDRAKRQGSIPYYGATGIIDHVDDHIFDGTYLLIGEDGSVEKKDGTAFSQYVSGKIWVNNHAHVLIGKGSISTEFLYLAFQFVKVSPFVTGAVQLKISQTNLRSIPITSPPPEISEQFQKIVAPMFERRLLLEKENFCLAELRDTILPKLISGELRIPDAEKFLEEAGI